VQPAAEPFFIPEQLGGLVDPAANDDEPAVSQHALFIRVEACEIGAVKTAEVVGAGDDPSCLRGSGIFLRHD